jgi:hypothetical protein
MAAQVRCVNAREGVAASLDELGALQFFSMSRHAGIGAGEGNRTLVVSLEGFCSTIELHPLAPGQCHCHARAVNRRHAVDQPQAAAVPRDSHEQPGRHRCILNRSPVVVAEREPCGAMARLID